MKEAIQSSKDNNIHLIIVTSLDRIVRDWSYTLEIKETLQEAGVAVVDTNGEVLPDPKSLGSSILNFILEIGLSPGEDRIKNHL